MIPYGRQEITEDDIASVVEVLKSDFLTQGPKVPAFEDAIKDATNAKYAIAANSATSALHIACMALGVGRGDSVWTSPISFVASSNCALYCGATVDFVDIDPATYNMCPQALDAKLRAAEITGNLPKVVIPVHLCGQSADMKEIYQLGQKYGFSIVEDASHAIGAKYKGKPVGNCDYSDICVFSFHPVKIVTTAEGGVATTQDETLAQKMSMLRTHGITRSANLMTEESHGPWYYQQLSLGYNYRMTELQAALGVSQMTRLHDFVSRRQTLAKRYDKDLLGLPIDLPHQLPETYSSYHLYVIQLKLNELSKSHEQVFVELRDKGLGVNLHYIPIHLQPYYSNLGFKPGDYIAAESYYERAISIPIFHAMSDEQYSRVVEILENVIK